MTDPKQTGLTSNLGDEMSERAGYYDESESGDVDTPTGQGVPDSSAIPDDTLGDNGSGTSFDAGGVTPPR